MYKMRPASRGGEVVSSVAFYELRTRNSGAGGDSYALLYLLTTCSSAVALEPCARPGFELRVSIRSDAQRRA